MGIDLDFGDVGGFEPMPDGVYVVRVNDAPIKENKAKDGSMIVLEFDVVEPEEYALRKLWLNVSLKPQARWKLQEVLEALTKKDWREDGMNLDPIDLLGELANAEVFSEEYNGRVNNKINRVFPYEG